MTRLTVIIFVLFGSLAAPARAQENRPIPSPPIVADTAEKPDTAPDVQGAPIRTSTTAGQQLVRPAVPLPPRPTRRRPSTVGYLDDPLIGSKVRLRYDIGLHNNRPDRAEFFYAKCGCYATGFSEGDAAFDPAAPGPGPGIVTDLNFRQMYFQAEFGGSRASVFAELPIRWIQPQSFAGSDSFGNQGGISDLRAGVKLALASGPASAVTLQVRGVLPTGDPAKGLGTNHATLEPALLFYGQAGDRVVIEGQAGLWLPIGGSAGVPIHVDRKFAGKVFFYGIGPSVEVYRGERLSVAPVVELVAWRILDGFQTSTIPNTGDATGTNIFNIKFGARIAWDSGGSVYAGYGRALSDAKWYESIFRFEYRHSF
jgi:hypothetical protein